MGRSKMPYYILYPKLHKKAKVKIVKQRPSPKQYSKTYGFAEGPLKTKKSVCARLNWMNVPISDRPINFPCPI